MNYSNRLSCLADSPACSTIRLGIEVTGKSRLSDQNLVLFNINGQTVDQKLKDDRYISSKGKRSDIYCWDY